MNISELISGAKTVGITGHIRPDGDCVGSTMGLYNYIRDNMPWVEVDVYLEQPGEEFNYITNIDKIKSCVEPHKSHDVFFVIDCGSLDRIEPFQEQFKKAKKTVCLDHHVSNTGFADESLVIPQASSACEVLFQILDENCISKAVAECIYTGIIHDTGVFKYSATSAHTMTIAGKMMEKGIDYSDIIDNSFYKKTYVQNQILGRALLESVLFYEGKCIFSVITSEVLNFYGVTGKELSGVVEQLRLTDGVEVAILMYQVGTNEYKVSLRSKKVIDVSRIAIEFGGGGHVRAAGFNATGTVHQIINRISNMIEEQFEHSN